MLTLHSLWWAPGSKKRLERHRQKLYRLAYSWCSNATLADDLVQETFYKALKKSDQVRESQLLDRWLCKIMVNCWRDHLRRIRHTEDIDNICLADTTTPELETQRAQDKARVHAAVDRLPEGQREVLTLVDLADMPYADVAAILEIPIGTVMSRISRARSALRNHLNREGGHGSKGEKPAAGPVIRRIK